MRRPNNFKNQTMSDIRLAFAFAVCLLAFSGFAQEAAPEAAKTAEAESALPVLDPPKSVFVSEPRELENKKTLDPFFPKSVRRNPIPKGPTPEELKRIEEEKAAEAARKKAEEAAAAVEVALPPDPFDDLELKGVIGGSRPMATIYTRHKNYLFSPGEWKMVQVPNVKTGELRRVYLECVSIKGEEVTIKLEDKPELRTLNLPGPAEDDSK